MKTRVVTLLLSAGLLTAAAFTALTFPAAAQTQTVYVQLPTGEVVPVTVDVPPGSTIDDIQLPGPQVPAPTTPTPPPVPTVPNDPSAPTPANPGDDQGPSSDGGAEQERSSSGQRVQDESDQSRELTGRVKSRAEDEVSKRKGRRSPLRNADGTPTISNPGFTDVLPGPSTATGVPNFIIRKFRVPPFLLSIYQAAGIEYGIRWEVLAAINEIETDYGRNLNVSSAGALGWMQFMPSTWKMYGTDANKDGRKDPYNPVDAIFAAARYLKAAGYEQDVRRAIFAYNHADWYVDSVLLRARLIAGVPAD
ncbi:MAG TPA: lytic transglycosylase domain-containing protein, partial [Thermoleophilaceae bacterium]